MPNALTVPAKKAKGKKVRISKEEVIASRKAVGKRITEFYTGLGLTRSDFAEILGVDYHNLFSYEEGRTEPGSIFLAKFNVQYPSADICYLMTGNKTLLDGYTSNEIVPFMKIPIVDSIPQEGFSEGVPQEYIIGWTFTHKINSSFGFALLVRGDALEPDAKDGSHIVLTPTDDPKNGSICILTSKTGLLLKRVYKNEKGYRLASASSSEPSRPVKKTEIGKMFQVIEISTRFFSSFM